MCAIYRWTSVIRPPVIRISLLSGCDLAVYIMYFSFISTFLLNLLCLLSISLISEEISSPDKCRSRHGRITEIGLYIFFLYKLCCCYNHCISFITDFDAEGDPNSSLQQYLAFVEVSINFFLYFIKCKM